MLPIIAQIFEVVIIPLLGVLTIFLVNYFKAKTSEVVATKDNELEKKYITLLSETVNDCVIATTQTYVQSLKEQNKFDAEAQKIAFNKTYEAVMQILSEDAKEYLTEAVGDLELYVTQKIESTVKTTK